MEVYMAADLSAETNQVVDLPRDLSEATLALAASVRA